MPLVEPPERQAPAPDRPQDGQEGVERAGRGAQPDAPLMAAERGREQPGLAEGLDVSLGKATGVVGLGGASGVTSVDIAPEAIALADATWEANGLDPARHRGLAEDARDFLRIDKERYELVVSDPPSFAPRESALESAIAAYEGLHAQCLDRLVPGGMLLAASCSSHVDANTFHDTLAKASAATGRRVQILERTGAPFDHPRLAAFPEGDYLKVVVARVLD